MARRKRDETPWRFYVYALMDGEQVAYVGKGSSSRLQNQRRAFGLVGHELARFKHERDAYTYERRFIADLKPTLNKCAGGNGSWASWEKPMDAATRATHRASEALHAEIDRIGSRAVVAKYLLTLDWKFLPSEIDHLRQVAHG